MKRVLSSILLLTMLFIVMAGCKKQNKPTNTGNTQISQTQKQDNTTSTKTDANTNTSTNEKEEEPTATDDSSKGDSVFIKGFVPMSKSQEILENFKEFGFVYNTNNADGNTSWSFQYTMLGKENIDGVETERVKINQVEGGVEKVSEGWYNSEWEAIKYINNEGKEKVGMDAAFEGMGLGMMTQLYSNLLTIAQSTFDEEGIVDDYMYTVKGKRSQGESMDFGTGATNVDLYDVEAKIGTHDKLFGIATIGSGNVYVVLENISKDKSGLEGLRITRAIPR